MTLTGIINLFISIGMKLIPLMASLAFLAFVFGVAKFIGSAGNEKDSKDSKNLLIWGIIGLFILVTIWGIISFLKGEFGLGAGVEIPQIRFRGAQ